MRQSKIKIELKDPYDERLMFGFSEDLEYVEHGSDGFPIFMVKPDRSIYEISDKINKVIDDAVVFELLEFLPKTNFIFSETLSIGPSPLIVFMGTPNENKTVKYFEPDKDKDFIELTMEGDSEEAKGKLNEIQKILNDQLRARIKQSFGRSKR